MEGLNRFGIFVSGQRERSVSLWDKHGNEGHEGHRNSDGGGGPSRRKSAPGIDDEHHSVGVAGSGERCMTCFTSFA